MRDTLILALILLILFVGWLYGVRDWYQSVQAAGPTLADHLAHRPPPERRSVLATKEAEYLILVGPTQIFPRFPSGPPVYVFDTKGRLIDWTVDEGDDEKFHHRWPGLFGGRTITPTEVNAWPAG